MIDDQQLITLEIWQAEFNYNLTYVYFVSKNNKLIGLL